MSLCNVCRSIPFRKVITREKHDHTLERAGFRFNAVGRTSSIPNDNLPWNERRCTIAEMVSRAKTCPLCAYILLKINQTSWCTTWERGRNSFTLETIETVVPQNPMVWMRLPSATESHKPFRIALGTPHCVVTSSWLLVYIRLLFGNFHAR